MQKRSCKQACTHTHVYLGMHTDTSAHTTAGACRGGWGVRGFNQEIRLQGFHVSRTGRCSSPCFTQWITERAVLESFNPLSIKLMLSQVLYVQCNLLYVSCGEKYNLVWDENKHHWFYRVNVNKSLATMLYLFWSCGWFNLDERRNCKGER